MWPIHPKPRSDELLSSWITRLAIANKMSTSAFCDITLPENRAVFKEIDRVYSLELMQALSEGTGTPIERILESSLLHDEGYVFKYRQYGTTNWVLPTSNNPQFDKKGMTFCPQCFAEDEKPYYRKSWRFAFNPICPTHKTLLIQNCPDCNKPYDYYHFGALTIHNVDAIRHCRWCISEFKNIQSSPTTSPFIDRVLTIQERIKNGIEAGTFEIGGYTVSSLIYLDGLHGLMNTLTEPANSSWVARNFTKELPKGIDLFDLSLNTFQNVIEMHKPTELGALLCLADILMDEWPVRFKTYAEKMKLTASRFKSPNRSIPFWISDSCPELFAGRRYSPSKEEIQAASLMLKRKLKRKEAPKELKHFMSTGVAKSLVLVDKRIRDDIALSSEKFALESFTNERNPYKVKYDDSRKLVAATEKLSKIAVLRKTKKTEETKKDEQLDLF